MERSRRVADPRPGEVVRAQATLRAAVSTEERILLTFAEVARLCSTSKRSIMRAVLAGELRAVQAPGTRGSRGRRIVARDIDAWLLSQEQERQLLVERFKSRSGCRAGPPS